MAGSIKRYSGKSGKVSWQVRLRKGKRLITGSFGTKRMAEEFIALHEAELVQEKYFGIPASQQPQGHTVANLLDLYQARIVSQLSEGTRGTYGRCLAYWRRALGECLVQNVTPSLIEECRYYLLHTKGLDPQTVNLYCFSLKPAFTYAASEMLNWIQRNPFDKIRKLKEPPGLAPMFTDQQIRDLLMWCDRSKSPHLSLYARMILGTGARKQEILRATWGQISFRRKTMTFTKTKSKRQRMVPLPTALVELLRYHYDHRFGEDAGLMNFPEQEYLFPSARDPRKPAVNIHAAWNRARRRAGLPEFRIHSGRHHYASRLITDGQADILAVSILLGHSDVKQTARYAHLSQSHLTSVVEKMAEHIVM